MKHPDNDPHSNSECIDAGAFPQTAWSMICQMQGVDAEESSRGWERLAKAYWQPLYAFLRRRGADHHVACDDVQGFFAHILSKAFLRRIEPGNGLFRSFLLTALQNWRADQHRAAVALKRGGGQAPIPLEELNLADVPFTAGTAEEAYDRLWARAVYDQAITVLRERLVSRGRGPQFDQLHGLLTGLTVAKYQEIASALGMSEGAVKQAATDLRREFGGVLRGEIRKTVADDSQVDGEVRYLLGLMRGER
ncbi:MAG: sigma-70 family RNA polymerase sigma factor [Verrucomicrobiales bacterium]|nr:sigma-70 family RNA polymerase sigma factor [Verrucomicrobiales bacterium]